MNTTRQGNALWLVALKVLRLCLCLAYVVHAQRRGHYVETLALRDQGTIECSRKVTSFQRWDQLAKSGIQSERRIFTQSVYIFWSLVIWALISRRTLLQLSCESGNFPCWQMNQRHATHWNNITIFLHKKPQRKWKVLKYRHLFVGYVMRISLVYSEIVDERLPLNAPLRFVMP